MGVDSHNAGGPLAALGWGPFFERERAEIDPALILGRVRVSHREHYQLLTSAGPLRARLGGRLRHDAGCALDLPAVGDWVAATAPARGRTSQVVHLLRRRTRFVRKVAGRRTEVQVVAANVDHVAVVTAPDGDFSVRRLERYLSAIRESGAAPLFILNKVDLCHDPTPFVRGFHEVSRNTPVLLTHALHGKGIEEIRARNGVGETLVFVGSSGVGKSTLVNRLLGRDVQRVGETRARDNRGRHVTSHRELFLLEGGGVLMDTPGMRELQVWAFGDEEIAGFSDIEHLAQECRFRDCSHQSEPGCAVRAAIEEGTLAESRLAGYLKLRAEVEQQVQRQEPDARLGAKSTRSPLSKH